MQDKVALESDSRLELKNILGTWLNVNKRADFIGELSLAFDGQGLKLTILSASQVFNESQVCLDVYPVAGPGSELATGFYHFQQGPGLIYAANEKNGVLVLQTYRQAAQDNISNAPGQSGAVGHLLTREFYYRQTPLKAPETNRQRADETRPLPKGIENVLEKEGFHALAGIWRNTHENSRGLKGFTIEKKTTGRTLVVHGNYQGLSWPEMPLTPYRFDQLEMGFIAFCQTNRGRALFCAYSNKGLIVVSAFFAFAPEAKAKATSLFCREFYVKESGVEVVTNDCGESTLSASRVHKT